MASTGFVLRLAIAILVLVGFCNLTFTKAQGYYGTDDDNQQKPLNIGYDNQFANSANAPAYEDAPPKLSNLELQQRCMAQYPVSDSEKFQKPEPDSDSQYPEPDSGIPSMPQGSRRNPQRQPGTPPGEPKEPQQQPEQPRYPPQNPRNPQVQQANPEEQPRNPQGQPRYPEDQPRNPQGQPGYPPEQLRNPQIQPGNPPQQPGYPQEQPEDPEQPRNPQGQSRYPQEPPKNRQEEPPNAEEQPINPNQPRNPQGNPPEEPRNPPQQRNPPEQPRNPPQQRNPQGNPSKQPRNPPQQQRNPQGQPRYPEEEPNDPEDQPRYTQEEPSKPQGQTKNARQQPNAPQEQPGNPDQQAGRPPTQNRNGGRGFPPNSFRPQRARPEPTTGKPDEGTSSESDVHSGEADNDSVQSKFAEPDPEIDPRIKAPPKSTKKPAQTKNKLPEGPEEPASLDTEASPQTPSRQTLSNLPTEDLIKLITDLNDKLQTLEESQKMLNKNVDDLQASIKAIPAKRKEATQELVAGNPEGALQKWNELGENVNSVEQLQNETAELVTDALEEKARPQTVMDFVHEIPNKPTQITAYNAVADKMAESDEIQESMNWKEMTPYCRNAGRDTGPASPTTRKMLNLQNQMRLKANQPIAQGSSLIQEQRYLPAANVWLNLVQDIPENPLQLQTNMKAMMIRTYAKNPFNLPMAFRFILVLPESQGIYKKVAYNCLLDEMRANGHSYDPSNSRQGRSYRIPRPDENPSQLSRPRRGQGQIRALNNEGYQYY